jgi:hypothetical protein
MKRLKRLIWTIVPMGAKVDISLTHQPIELLCRQVHKCCQNHIRCGHDIFIQSVSVVVYDVDGVRHMDVTWWKVQAVWGWSSSF